MKFLGIEDKAINIVLVNDYLIHKLNRQFLNKDSPTDVLSFSYFEKSGLWGEVVISLDTAKRSAERYGNDLKKEFYLYLIHGILHLIGYRDKKPKERKRMESVQKRLLALIDEE